MERLDAPIEPMTLGNMRANGVRSLAVSCMLCHHEAVVDAAPGTIASRCRRSAPA
jgi:hypothetical protein